MNAILLLAVLGQLGAPEGVGGVAGVTLTSTQVAYGSATNSVTGEAAFTYNATTDTLTVGTLATNTIRGSDGNQKFFSSTVSGNVWSQQAAGTVNPMFSIENTNALTTGTLLRVRASTTDYLTITSAGLAAPAGLVVNTTTARPACAVALRGLIWVTQGGAGVADVWEKCGKDAADAYNWSAL